MKLRYKFFTAFLITSFLIVVLLVGIMQVFVNRNFAEFVNRQELESLGDLVSALATDYKKYGGWDHIREDHWHWRNILDETFPVPDEVRRNPSRLRPPPRGNKPESRRPEHRPPPPGRGEEPLNIKARLNLFDSEKQHVAGPRRPDDRFLYREIVVDGERAGWLGMKVPDKMMNPLGLHFLKAQKKAIYVFGIGILVLAAAISYLMSKHLISPIQALMKGTRAMALFQFDTEIDVRSNDELGQLADDFNHMARTLKRYEDMRKQWVSDISHELRTPIAILKGKIEALQDGIRKMTPDTLESLHKDVSRLGLLVDDLHYLSLSDSETLHVKMELVNPLTVLKEAIDSFQIRLDSQSISVEENIALAGDISLMANKDSLSRLFSNLIENTLRYTDSPGIVKLTYEVDHSWFTLCYEDSSPGVPDDGLPLIFNRLYRVDQSRSRALGGSGLGLSICRQIVENHKGTIVSDHSSLGGLKITIRLPVA